MNKPTNSKRDIKSPRGNTLNCKSWSTEAAFRMIQNNLDYSVAQHPHELITYGGNGAVFQNWIQYRLAMKYLAEMTDERHFWFNLESQWVFSRRTKTHHVF